MSRVNDQPIVLRTVAARLTVPGGAYAVGTHVTLRLVGSLRMDTEADSSFFGYLAGHF